MRKNQFVAAAILAAFAEFLSAGSCLGADTISKTIDSSVQQTDMVLADGIRQIGMSSQSWQTVLQDMQSKLTSDAQTTVRNEISNLLTNSIGVANAGVQCDVDFIGHRVIQALQAIEAKVLNQTPPPAQPVTCDASPSGIEFAHWQQNGVPKVDVFGYDLDAPLTVELVGPGSQSDVTFALSRASGYHASLNLGGNGIPLTAASQRIELRSGVTVVSSIPIIQPVTPVCTVKTVVLTSLPPINYAPPKIQGDDEFFGHGPDMSASLSLSPTGPAVRWSLSMSARETVADFTTVSGTKTGILYTADPGWTIDSIVGPPTSSYGFRSAFTTSASQPVVQQKFPGSGPVAEFDFIGDTEGPDVGRTGVLVKFNAISVVVAQNTNCVPPTVVKKLLDRNQLTPTAQSRLRNAMPANFTPR